MPCVLCRAAPEDEVEYEMDADDDAFLKRLAADKIVCQPDKFEMIVDKCEKESHRLVLCPTELAVNCAAHIAALCCAAHFILESASALAHDCLI
jgi:hypothetical protein